MLIPVLVMAGELVRFCWTKLTVVVWSHHFFRAYMLEWDIATVITVKTLAYDVETLKVRMNDGGSVSNYMSNNRKQ